MWHSGRGVCHAEGLWGDILAHGDHAENSRLGVELVTGASQKCLHRSSGERAESLDNSERAVALPLSHRKSQKDSEWRSALIYI